MSDEMKGYLNEILTWWRQEEGVTAVLRNICERLQHIVNLPSQPAREIEYTRLPPEEVEQ